MKCQFCGSPAKSFIFAAFVCDGDECIERAKEARRGPGGSIAWTWDADSWPGS
jgi:hypothetical protein